MDYSFLYETLPFLNELKCHILLLDNNISYGAVGRMYASWQRAREYIISNNINFDYCIKIRPDFGTVLAPDKFNDLFEYCVYTNNIVLIGILFNDKTIIATIVPYIKVLSETSAFQHILYIIITKSYLRNHNTFHIINS